jgi:hypothetical protein
MLIYSRAAAKEEKEEKEAVFIRDSVTNEAEAPPSHASWSRLSRMPLTDVLPHGKCAAQTCRSAIDMPLS